MKQKILSLKEDNSRYMHKKNLKQPNSKKQALNQNNLKEKNSKETNVTKKISKKENLKQKYILGIETSCDDTSIGYISLDKKIVKHYTYNQIEHAKYRGVVPTLAARKHLENIQIVMQRVLKDIDIQDIKAVAVTVGPGLIASLMIGVNYAKMLAYLLNIDLIPIHHLEGHMFSAYMHKVVQYPYLTLLVSGGHTQYILAHSFMKYEIMGGTIDDALGECFDKVGIMLGIEYPAGAAIEKLALKGNKNAYNLPLPLIKNVHKCNMSFSGLKTAVLHLINRDSMHSHGEFHKTRNIDSIDASTYQNDGNMQDNDIKNSMNDSMSNNIINNIKNKVRRNIRGKNISSTALTSNLTMKQKNDIAASFQNTICKIISAKTRIAFQKLRDRSIVVENFIIAGGVSANQYISNSLSQLCNEFKVKYINPELKFCMDNGSMIARAGLEYFDAGINLQQKKAIARWSIESLIIDR